MPAAAHVCKSSCPLDHAYSSKVKFLPQEFVAMSAKANLCLKVCSCYCMQNTLCRLAQHGVSCFWGATQLRLFC